MRQVKLFCLPYGGGSAYSYLKWKSELADVVQLCPVELTGRGKRFSEPYYNSIEEAVDDVYKSIKPDLNQTPYAIFGHSMGSIILYELYFKIMEMNHKAPVHLFISGRKAPEIPDYEITYNLPELEFTNKVMQYEGTPREIFDNKELADIFIPLLRADFKIVQTYQYKPTGRKMDTNVTVMYGKDDIYTYGDTGSWKKHVNGSCEFHVFNGGHFFIHNDKHKVVEVINTALLNSFFAR
ncbi:thioesterase II family protein [Paenibacillus donghaensis]|uniref:Thioesterase domain-containing protein n=1 Tax=Paenibacillus donghaensis TaxID=414771 RepID=A0A2Z2KAJ4_9BACL|nr:thioesterase domain-containing protein [Paenibacillus donghaensis]ASA20595.1 hypothetical protein B9T62_07170 [Paenibacillus donghaensis]